MGSPLLPINACSFILSVCHIHRLCAWLFRLYFHIVYISLLSCVLSVQAEQLSLVFHWFANPRIRGRTDLLLTRYLIVNIIKQISLYKKKINVSAWRVLLTSKWLDSPQLNILGDRRKTKNTNKEFLKVFKLIIIESMHNKVFASQVGSIKQIPKKALTFMIKYKVTEYQEVDMSFLTFQF